MDSRIELQTNLEAVLGSRNVYFQPPESLKMSYPAIVYELADIVIDKANDKSYIRNHRYTLTLIHKDPDNDLKDDLLDEFRHISFDRAYASDGLYHYVYDLYYD